MLYARLLSKGRKSRVETFISTRTRRALSTGIDMLAADKVFEIEEMKPELLAAVADTGEL